MRIFKANENKMFLPSDTSGYVTSEVNRSSTLDEIEDNELFKSALEPTSERVNGSNGASVAFSAAENAMEKEISLNDDKEIPLDDEKEIPLDDDEEPQYEEEKLEVKYI